MGAVKVILDTLGPRDEELKNDESIHKSRSAASLKLIKGRKAIEWLKTKFGILFFLSLYT